MPKKVLIALPPGLLEQVDYIAKVEHRNRSELIREALRRYLDNFRRTQGATLQPVTAPAPQPIPQPVQVQPIQQQTHLPEPKMGT